MVLTYIRSILLSCNSVKFFLSVMFIIIQLYFVAVACNAIKTFLVVVCVFVSSCAALCMLFY